MRKILFAMSAVCIVFASCKEQHNLVNLTPTPTSSNTDTTYVVTAIPAADAHNVLVEEFTGQSCSNCPAAHTALENLAAQNSGRVNIIGLYFYGNPQCIPPTGYVYDFRDSVCSSIANTIYGGVSGIPVGGVDRVPSSNTPPLQIYSSGWGDAINSRLSVMDSMNLKIESTFDNATNAATIKATVTYTKAVSTPENLTIVVVEDSMADKQEFPSTVQDGYVFTNVFRAMISSVPFGNPLQVSGSDSKEAGRVFERFFVYQPKTVTPAIVPKHCRIIAYVNTANGSDYHVAQSAQCKLVP